MATEKRTICLMWYLQENLEENHPETSTEIREKKAPKRRMISIFYTCGMFMQNTCRDRLIKVAIISRCIVSSEYCLKRITLFSELMEFFDQ